jgi:hypothetical protein
MPVGPHALLKSAIVAVWRLETDLAFGRDFLPCIRIVLVTTLKCEFTNGLRHQKPVGFARPVLLLYGLIRRWRVVDVACDEILESSIGEMLHRVELWATPTAEMQCIEVFARILRVEHLAMETRREPGGSSVV